MLFHLRFI